MGQHKHNPRALMNAALPPALPAGREAVGQVETMRVLKPHLMVMPADAIREVDGKTEILIPRREVRDGQIVDTEPQWGPVPEGRKAMRVGEKLENADLDMAHVLVSYLVDHRLVDAKGNAPATKLILAELHRMDFTAWLEAHEAQKGPGLVV